ncbi:hypothetical protein CYMTET_25232 [Cymbomonas tetramitiformis]|uniref:Uncharacterized protein n=1 Tax=Cymbomonas tetramitiformis TaxID=36881 RepID=A0AAE0FU93_9CHLO|nr:hypothetical protein CYMTET_25232 [Cymbomonas tetramitiformis]
MIRKRRKLVELAAAGGGSLDRLHRGNRQHWLGPLDNLFSRHPEKIAPTLSEFVSKQSPDVQRDVVRELCGTKAGFGMLLIENVKEGFTWLARSASKLIDKKNFSALQAVYP